MPSTPIPYSDNLDLPQVQSVLGRRVDAAWVAAQVNSGHLTAPLVENPEDPEADPIPSTTLVTRESVAQFAADHAPGGPYYVPER